MFQTLRRQLTLLAASALIAGSAIAGGENWTEDFEGAKTTAKQTGKDLLLDFTGSDWCVWCVRLNDEVFSKDAFKNYAEGEFVLVELDYPRNDTRTAEVKAQNEKLKNKYAIRGYPTILLTDEQGRPYAKTGYQRGGADNYVAHLKELKQIRVNRDEQFAAAEKATGVEKAKHLHEAMQLLGDDMALQYYEPTVKKIIELDADNKAGLKQHYNDLYTAKKQREELAKIMQGLRADPDGAIAKLDTMLAKQDLVTAVRQEALATKAQVQLYVVKDKEAAKATLQQAIEVDPDSDMAKQLTAAMGRLFPDE
ncbi:MAG: thioredoxin family protein [Phycisphaeraceae bacterium]